MAPDGFSPPPPEISRAHCPANTTTQEITRPFTAGVKGGIMDPIAPGRVP